MEPGTCLPNIPMALLPRSRIACKRRGSVPAQAEPLWYVQATYNEREADKISETQRVK